VIVERTYDIEEINYVLKHPSVERFLCDDFSKDVEYPVHDNLYYLVARENDIIAGMFLMFPLNGVTIDSHVAILPEFYGEKAKDAGKLAVRWIFENTEYLKMNAVIPEYNKLALKFVSDVGFQQEGINKNSFIRNGKLFNQIYFGLER